MIVRDLLSRQLSYRQKTKQKYHLSGPISRLTLEETLGTVNGRIVQTDAHKGCVNTLTFGHNQNSSLLLSGSDDATLKLWDLAGTTNQKTSRSPLATFDTNHTSNILAACFVRGCAFLPSVGMRGEVRLTTTVRNTTLLINNHTKGSYDIQSIASDPHLFWSCGGDGFVRRYDLRSSSKLGATNIIQCYDTNNHSAFVAMSFNPINPFHVACGSSSDPVVRIYDRRKISEVHLSKSAVVQSCSVQSIVSVSKTNKKRGRVTSIAYNQNGTELLISYSHDYVYLFDLARTGRNKQIKMTSIENTLESKKAKTFKVSPNDWSDTGPSSSTHRAAEMDDSPGARLSNELQDLLTSAFGGGAGGGAGDNAQETGETKETKETKEQTMACESTSIPEEEEENYIQPCTIYCGHRNCRTILKEATFYGMKNEYIISGSDCGRIFVWEKEAGTCLGAIESDTRVVNCFSTRKHDLLLASSGIDHSIKLFSPIGTHSTMNIHRGSINRKRKEKKDDSNSNTNQIEYNQELNRVITGNEEILNEQKENSTILRLPPSLVLRMLIRMRRQRTRASEESKEEEEEEVEEDEEDKEDEEE